VKLHQPIKKCQRPGQSDKLANSDSAQGITGLGGLLVNAAFL
jgi:hypothetical protein